MIADRFYVSGSSDERSTWGPHFPLDGRYVYEGSSLNNWTFDGKLTSITWEGDVYVEYTVLFRYPAEYAGASILRTVAVPFTTYPSHSIWNATDSFGVAVSSSHVPLPGPPESTATLIHLVGHLHVGGLGVNVTLPSTGQEICYSAAIHSESEKCYIEVVARFSLLLNSLVSFVLIFSKVFLIWRIIFFSDLFFLSVLTNANPSAHTTHSHP
jgi:hypothetical protein